MRKSYRLVVFDWEGTLGDTVGLVLHSVAQEAKRLNFGEINDNLARQCVGLGLLKAIQKIFPYLSQREHIQLMDAVQLSLRSRHSDVFLIPGAEETVAKLYSKGIGLAIATNKGQQSLQRALQTTGLDKYFKVTRSAGQTAPKPDPEMLNQILQEFSLASEEALMIGDSPSDMEMASFLNMDACGVNFYHQDPNILFSAGALEVFDDYQSLSKFLF